MDELAARVAERVPALAGAALRPVESGWTCDTYEAVVGGERWIVQTPRSPGAAERLRVQGAVLPELGREVSAAVPSPAAPVGEPPLLIYTAIEGAPCTTTPGIWPERLGRFLYDLHAVPPEFVGLRAATAASVREGTRRDLATLVATVAPAFEPGERGALDRVVAALVDDDDLWGFAPCVTHGDLGPEHVLVTQVGDLAGVIDWEEVAIDDPAVDLAWWLHAMPEEGDRALGAYGGTPDRGFRARARLRFVIMPWHEVAYGLGGGGGAFVASGLEGSRERLTRYV